MKKFFEDNLSHHQEVFSNLLHLSEVILEASELIVSALNKNGKIIFCGNGGSASDSQHLAAEFVGRFNKDRISMPAMSLTSDSAVVTAIANDYGYEKVFSRQLEGLGLSNDVIFCISTSGNSKNILEVLKKAKDMSIKSILLSNVLSILFCSLHNWISLWLPLTKILGTFIPLYMRGLVY